MSFVAAATTSSFVQATPSFMAATTSQSSLWSIANPNHTSSRRWHMLAIYMLIGMVNQSLWLSFAAAPAATARRYEVTEGAIAGIAVSANMLFLPGSWLASRLLKKSGLGRVVLIACWMQMFGSVARWLADLLIRPISAPSAFLVILLGQSVTALASPLVMNTPAVFSEAWFGRRERETVLAAGTLSPIVGQGLGAVAAGFIIEPDAVADGTGQLLVGQAVLSCVIAVWATFSFSVPAARRSPGNTSTCAEWSKLLCRPNFVLIIIIFDLGLGLSAALLAFFGEIAEKCGYEPDVAGVASAVYGIGGMFGSMAVGVLLGATRAYRTILRLSIFCAVLSAVALFVALRPDNTAALLVATMFFGTFMMSALPALICNAVEETFPVSAESSTGLLFISGVGTQVVLTPLTQFVVAGQGDVCSSFGSPLCRLVLGVAIFGCLLPALLYRGKNKRALSEAQEDIDCLAVN